MADPPYVNGTMTMTGCTYTLSCETTYGTSTPVNSMSAMPDVYTDYRPLRRLEEFFRDNAEAMKEYMKPKRKYRYPILNAGQSQRRMMPNANGYLACNLPNARSHC